MDAWTNVVLQIAKIFLLNRVTAKVFRKEGRFSVDRYFLLQRHLGVPGLRSFDGIARQNGELKQFEKESRSKRDLKYPNGNPEAANTIYSRC